MDYTKYFERVRRPNGIKFVKLTNDAPENLRDLINTIHKKHFCNCLPNDWIYEVIHDAFDDFNFNLLEDITIEANIYNHDLAYWFYNNCNQYAHEYCNEWLEDCYYKDLNIDMIEIIRKAQEVAKIRIYCLVNDFIQQQKEVKNDQ